MMRGLAASFFLFLFCGSTVFAHSSGYQIREYELSQCYEFSNVDENDIVYKPFRESFLAQFLFGYKNITEKLLVIIDEASGKVTEKEVVVRRNLSKEFRNGGHYYPKEKARAKLLDEAEYFIAKLKPFRCE